MNQLQADSFGTRLKKARESRKISQQSLADLINAEIGTDLKRTSISNYENEVSYPTLEIVKGLSKILDVSGDYLLGITDRPGVATLHGIANEVAASGNPLILYYLEDVTTVTPLIEFMLRLETMLVYITENKIRDLSLAEVEEIGRDYLEYKQALLQLNNQSSIEDLNGFKALASSTIHKCIFSIKRTLEKLEEMLYSGISDGWITIEEGKARPVSATAKVSVEKLLSLVKR